MAYAMIVLFLVSAKCFVVIEATCYMHAQMRRRKRVLRRLGHCDSEGVIQLKGRVACEINTCDELVVTELIFCGAFTELSPEQSAALLSCMVHQVSFVRVRCVVTRRSSWIMPIHVLGLVSFFVVVSNA